MLFSPLGNLGSRKNESMDGTGGHGFFLPHILQADSAIEGADLDELLREAAEELLSNGDADVWKEFFSNKTISYMFTNDMMNDSSLLVFETALTNLEYYLVPLIIIIGLVGNTLSFVVFVCTHLKRNSCHIYLASLSLADNLFLFCVFISWGDKIGISLHTKQGWCQTQIYLTHVASFLSAWYVVSFTFERYLVACRPHLRSKLCTTKVAIIVVVSLAIFGLVAYSYTLFTSGVMVLSAESQICGPLPEYSHVVSTINNIDTLLTLVIPIVIIAGCNIKIAYVVYTFYKHYRNVPKQGPIQKWDFSGSTGGHRRRNIENVSAVSRSNKDISMAHISCSLIPAETRNKTSSSVSCTADSNGGHNSFTGSSYMRATRMLLIVSSVFVICNLPSHVTRTYQFIMTMVSDQYYQVPITFILVQRLFQIFYYMNFAVNFFLYSLSGQSFRNGLKRLKMKVARKCRDCSCQRQQKEQHLSPHIKYKNGKLNVDLVVPDALAKCL